MKKRRRKNPPKFDRCVEDVIRKGRSRRKGKRVRDPFAVCAASTGRRRRRKRNPEHSRVVFFRLVAQRPGGKQLVYLGGTKFAERGRAPVFRTIHDAKRVARELRRQFPVLKNYRFRAQIV